jgi:alpha-methylacyl-CoA racemase
MVMGPLAGVKVVEIAGLGAVPFAGMVLADLGAEVVRVDRPGRPSQSGPAEPALGRGQKSIAVDLKHPRGVDVVLRLVAASDALVEGFRPGVTERLGLGPDDCAKVNPRLVYGRMTGWGQTGPLSTSAGHDINYISLAGALHPIGRAGEAPVPPLNLLGDIAGGAMFLVLGVLAGVISARETGTGQVVDAAMVDGAALLVAPFFASFARGGTRDDRGVNGLDGGSPHYDAYETADGKYVSLGALEPQFWAEQLRLLELDAEAIPDRYDPAQRDALREVLSTRIKERTRDEWAAVFEGTDACAAPVLGFADAPQHPHNVARGTFVTVDGVVQPGPAPRFLGTPASTPEPAPTIGGDTRAVLAGLGCSDAEIDELVAEGAVAVGDG